MLISKWWAVNGALLVVAAAFNGMETWDDLWIGSVFAESHTDIGDIVLLGLFYAVVMPAMLLVSSPGLMIANLWRAWKSSARYGRTGLDEF